MKKRALALAGAVAMLSLLGNSAPSRAGTYISTVMALNTTSGNADEFDAVFTNTGGTISNVQVLVSGYTNPATRSFVPVTATPTIIDGHTGIKVNFANALPSQTGGLLVLQFLTSYGSIGIGSVDWKLTVGTDPPGTAYISTSSLVPEPGSMGLLGIGMTGLLSWRRLRSRKPSVRV